MVFLAANAAAREACDASSPETMIHTRILVSTACVVRRYPRRDCFVHFFDADWATSIFDATNQFGQQGFRLAIDGT